jgi:sigma-B regulation protein RsbU (phosphoserine phosphatase)
LAVITTDGVFEAMNPNKELFGIDRMLQCLREDRDRSAADMIANLRKTVMDYSAGQAQADDITAIAIRAEG